MSAATCRWPPRRPTIRPRSSGCSMPPDRWWPTSTAEGFRHSDATPLWANAQNVSYVKLGGGRLRGAALAPDRVRRVEDGHSELPGVVSDHLPPGTIFWQAVLAA